MYDRIRTYLSEQLDIPVEDMDRDTTVESLHLDSLDMVEMVMDMQEELGVDFETDGDMNPQTNGEPPDFTYAKHADTD